MGDGAGCLAGAGLLIVVTEQITVSLGNPHTAFGAGVSTHLLGSGEKKGFLEVPAPDGPPVFLQEGFLAGA